MSDDKQKNEGIEIVNYAIDFINNSTNENNKIEILSLLLEKSTLRINKIINSAIDFINDSNRQLTS